MRNERLEAGLVDWRKRLADGIARPLSRRTPLNVGQVRRAMGALFFAEHAIYVVRALRGARRR